MNKVSIVGLCCAIMANALWGFTFIGPNLTQPVGAAYLTQGRYLVLALLSLVIIMLRWKSLKSLKNRDLFVAIHLGIIGAVGFGLFMFLSVAISGGVIASLITGIVPVIVASIWNIKNKRTPWSQLTIPLIAIVTGFIIINAGKTANSIHYVDMSATYGVIFAFIASLSWAYFVICNSLYLQKLNARISNDLWTALIGIGTGVGSLVIIPFLRYMPGISPFSPLVSLWDFTTWSVVLGVFGSFVPTYFWSLASKRLPTIITAQLIVLETVFGAVFNLLWERRAPTIEEMAGGLLIIGGVVVSITIYEGSRS